MLILSQILAAAAMQFSSGCISCYTFRLIWKKSCKHHDQPSGLHKAPFGRFSLVANLTCLRHPWAPTQTISALNHCDTQWAVLLLVWSGGGGGGTGNYASPCMNAHRKHRWMKTPSGLYGLNIWTRLVCDRLCVCARVMASPDVAQFPEAWLLIRGAAQGHAAPLMLTLHALYFFWDSHYSCRTRSRPRSNGKNTCGSFPVQKAKLPTQPTGCARREPSLDWRTDWLSHISSCCFLSQRTHAGKLEQRGVFHGQTDSVAFLWSV